MTVDPEDAARAVLLMRRPCPEHPMTFPKPSCLVCVRNATLFAAAATVRGIAYSEPACTCTELQRMTVCHDIRNESHLVGCPRWGTPKRDDR